MCRRQTKLKSSSKYLQNVQSAVENYRALPKALVNTGSYSRLCHAAIIVHECTEANKQRGHTTKVLAFTAKSHLQEITEKMSKESTRAGK